MSVEGLERLDVWVKAREFAFIVHKEVLPLFPPEEKWAMAQQIQRSTQSIPANIAEGYGRYYYQHNVRFCYIARGSLNETLSHLVLARDLAYISESLFTLLVRESESLVRLINGYIGYLKRERRGADEPGSLPAVKESTEEYISDPVDDVSTV